MRRTINSGCRAGSNAESRCAISLPCLHTSIGSKAMDAPRDDSAPWAWSFHTIFQRSGFRVPWSGHSFWAASGELSGALALRKSLGTHTHSSLLPDRVKAGRGSCGVRESSGSLLRTASGVKLHKSGVEFLPFTAISHADFTGRLRFMTSTWRDRQSGTGTLDKFLVLLRRVADIMSRLIAADHREPPKRLSPPPVAPGRALMPALLSAPQEDLQGRRLQFR